MRTIKTAFVIGMMALSVGFVSCCKPDPDDEINFVQLRASYYNAGSFFMEKLGSRDSILAGSIIEIPVGQRTAFHFIPGFSSDFKFEYDVAYIFPGDSVVKAEKAEYVFTTEGEYLVKCTAVGTYRGERYDGLALLLEPGDQTRETIADFKLVVK